MKKNLLFLVLIPCFVLSQTITRPNIPDFGMEMRFNRSSSPVTPSHTGSWDYSSLNTMGNIPILISPVDPFNSVHNSYPDADFACAGCFFQDLNYLHFLTYSDSALKKYGGVDSVTWSNSGITLMPFPFSAGVSAIQGDTYSDAVSGPCCNGGSRTDSIYIHALGHGPLLLPDYNFLDAVLVQVSRIFTDPGYFVTLDSYQWWVQDFPLPVAESYVWKFNGGNIMHEGFDFLRSSTLDIKDESIESKISFFPNPSDNNIIINNKKNSENLNISIFDISGSFIKEISNIKNGENLNLDLNSGSYNLIIKGDDFSECKMIQIIK